MIVEAHLTINAFKAAVWAASTHIEHFAQLLSGVEKIEVMDKPATGLVGFKRRRRACSYLIRFQLLPPLLHQPHPLWQLRSSFEALHGNLTMIRDYLLPLLTECFPDRVVTEGPGVEPCATFPAQHHDVGDVQIYDDGDEITLIAGNFTHGHFSNYDDIPLEEKEKEIAEDVVDFLTKLFDDEVVLFGSHKGGGGWRVIDPRIVDRHEYKNEYVWSGPRNS